MKKAFIALLVGLTITNFVYASDSLCGTSMDAEDAVDRALDLKDSGDVGQSVATDDEALAGGKYIYRKILIKIGPKLNKNVVVSYSIVKSFDGPTNGDYCSLTGIEDSAEFCKRKPSSALCR